MIFLKNISKLLIVAYIPLVLMLFINSTVNKHQHILANGQIVIHAHPYKLLQSETSGQNHNHSKEELAFFALISDPLSMGLLFFVGIFVFLLSYSKTLEIFDSQFIVSDYSYALKNKAPPISILYY